MSIVSEIEAKERQTIYLGGGCFWCIEAVYDQTKGVLLSESGYMGGSIPNPTYDQVCSGNTGHAEVVKLEYDPALISLDEILKLFFEIHDPTTLNRQGNDVGSQYRSVIFYTSHEQQTIVEATVAYLQKTKFQKTMVTQVEKAPTYYRAEAYHQNYFRKNPNQGYCQWVVAPKVDKLHHAFPHLLRSAGQ